MSIEQQLQAALARVPSMSEAELKITRANAVAKGEVAAELIAAIDKRLSVAQAPEGMALHRLEFARHMLGLMDRYPAGQWVPSIDLVKRTTLECADNPYVAYVAANSARLIPLTKALDDSLPAFPMLERRKDGTNQAGRVYYRRRSA